MTRYGIQDMPETEDDRSTDLIPAPHYVTSTTPATLPARTMTLPNTYQPHNTDAFAHITSIAAGTMHGEMPRIPFPDKARWLVHTIPTAFGLAVDYFAIAAASEPDHGLFTAVPIGLGIFAGLGTVAAAVVGNQPSDSDNDNRDNSATRLIGGASVALLSIGAMTGAGATGIGGLGALGCLGGLNALWVGFQTWRRNRNQDFVLGLANAVANGTLPPGPGIVVEQLGTVPTPAANPYEHVTVSALDAMGYASAAVGAPKPISEHAWSIRAALPKGRNTSPDRLVAQADVLASNMGVRRVEIEPCGANIVEITVFDGPDTLGREYRYPWDGKVIESLSDPMSLFIDEARRILALVIDDHLLISGKSGGGKSKLVQQIIARTLGAADVVRIGIDCKPGAVELGLFEPSMHYLACTPLDAVRVHHGLKALIAERGQVLKEHEDDTWRPEYGPYILVACDERAVITRDFPEVGALIEENMQMGRFVGIRFLDSTQTPSGGVYGKKTDARHQYGIRIGFYNESTVNTMVFGGKASSEGWRLEKLQNAPGKALVRAYGHNVPRPYKSLIAERAEVLELVERFDGQYPELGPRCAAAFANGMDAYDAEAENGEGPEPPDRPRGRAVNDAVDVAQEYWGKPNLHVVRRYPDRSTMPEARAILWDAIAGLTDGFTYRDIAALNLPGYGGGRTSIQTPLDQWRARGWVVEIGKRGNTIVYALSVEAQPLRKDA